ncbi:hypothetical protein YA0089_13945 [Pseudomonas viridiflava]|uniref:hypothetical protein n=1 Tax=Pseudomonas viridiflava TaxID=33069 RepID=UPI0018E626B0|nr:hypothetical protein [Pseudomonas viridiflava]MBI6724721.1 hypothetical protein [Pseudomonas viridiflava]
MHKGISKRRRKARVLKVLVPFFAQSPQDILKETLAVILMSDHVTIKLPKVKQKYVRFEDLGTRHSFTWD